MLFYSGCGDHDAHSHDEDNHSTMTINPISEGCKHLDFGDAISLDTTLDAKAPTVHARYEIKLGTDPNDEQSFSGNVEFTSTGGHHYFMMTDVLDVSVTDPQGQELTPIKIHDAPVENCDSAQRVIEMMLDSGDHTLTFGPSSIATVEVAIHVDGVTHDHHHADGEGHDH